MTSKANISKVLITQEFSNIPDELNQLPQWVCWKYIKRHGKPTKMPCNPLTGNSASSTDSQTWGPFDDALGVFESQSSKYSGIGFTFSKDDPYCGIDVDNCIDPETGELKPWAVDLLKRLNSYTEISPSGTGVKVFIKGSKSGAKCRKAYHDGEVEIYDSGRYFTMTGAVMSDYSTDVEDRQVELERVYDMVIGVNKPKVDKPETITPSTSSESVDLSDDDILSTIRPSRQRDKFNALWDGNTEGYGGDHSSADLALCCILAFYTKDAGQIDRLFRKSGLLRDKWDKKRGSRTYGKITIDAALGEVTERYTPTEQSEPVKAMMPVDSSIQESTLLTTITHNVEASKPQAESAKEELKSKHKKKPTANDYAMALLAHRFTFDGVVGLKRHNKQWYIYENDSYSVYENEEHLHVIIANFLKDEVCNHGLAGDSSPGSGLISSIKQQLSVDDAVQTPRDCEFPCWLCSELEIPFDGDVICMKNGLLDVDAAVAGKPVEQCLYPHTPHWFSTSQLPYDYEPGDTCPLYDSTMNTIFAGNQELIELADQWHGYVICHDTSLHKMVIAYGEGGTGKSTWLTATEMLVGQDNCSHVSPDMFDKRFQLAPTVGKLLNTVAEEPDIDKVAVGKLKQFVSADPMEIERKGIDCFTLKPTARVMLGTNKLPHLNDSSKGIWRRLIMMPFDHMIPEEEMILDLDKLLQKELSGILNRAIRGRASLKKNGRFIEPEVCKQMKERYRLDCDPTREYLESHYDTNCGVDRYISKQFVYDQYKEYMVKNGHKPLSNVGLAKRIRQIFGVEDAKLPVGERKRVWKGLRYNNEDDYMSPSESVQVVQEPSMFA